MREFTGKVAVVTGAASGIGRGLAQRFAAEGMRVVLADIEQDALERAAAEMAAGGATVLPVRTDVASAESVEELARRTIDEFGAAHIVCNNAGVSGRGFGWEASLEDWTWTLGVNLWGVIHGVRSFVPRMIAGGEEGHIVNTASLAGLITNAGASPYAVSKHGVVALSEGLFLQLQARGHPIGVSVLCPGYVNTRILDAERNRPAELRTGVADSSEEDPAMAAARQWMRERLQSGMAPSEVAEKVVDAIREGRLYVLTHPELTPAVEQRMRNIIEGRNPTLPAGPARPFARPG